MADPNRRMYGAPFGAVPGFNNVQDQEPQPGFNATPADQAPGIMDSLRAALPTAEAWKQGTAETLGGPVDMGAWLLHAMGVPISGDKFYGGGAFTRGVNGQPTWAPSPSVPLSSQNIRGMLDSGPSPEALLMAFRRHGLF
jgi:hypothetical protein